MCRGNNPPIQCTLTSSSLYTYLVWSILLLSFPKLSAGEMFSSATKPLKMIGVVMTLKEKTVPETLRLATQSAPIRIPIAKVEIDPTKNVREPNVETWAIPQLAESLALEGQSTPCILQKIGEKYLPWQGFRRCSAVKYNAERGVIDPMTGKPFTEVLAFVINEELSIKDQFALLLDAGNTRLLNKVEVFYAAEKARQVWSTEAQIAIALRGLLDSQFPVKDPSVLENPEEYANYRKGVVQNLLTAAKSPVVLRDAYVEKLRGKQKWPSERDVRKLEKDFRTEMEADKTNKISRQKPGKEFMKTWNAYVADQKAAATNGSKPKAVAMMNGDEVQTAKNACDSRILKTVMAIVKRQIPQEHLPKLDALLVDIEAGKADVTNITKILDEISPTTPEPSPTEE